MSKLRNAIFLLRLVKAVKWTGIGSLREGAELVKGFVSFARNYRAMANSAWFDRQWYLANNPSVAEAGWDPVAHYLLHGAREGRAPAPGVDGARWSALASAGRLTAEHLRSIGQLEPLWPMPRLAVAVVPCRAAHMGQLLRALATVPLPYTLWLSVADEQEKADLLGHFDVWYNGAVEIRVGPPGSGDLASRLAVFGDVFRRFDVVLALSLETWPNKDLGILLASEAMVVEALEAVTGKVRLPAAGGATAFWARGAPEISKQQFRAEADHRLSEFLASDRRLCLPTSDRPVISILLVLYNSADLTFDHLLSLQQALGEPCEVIIVDNASSDRTRQLLERVDGARIVLNDDNRHFLLAVNQAARLAVGKFALLLNNDTRVRPDSLAIARRILEDDPTIGAVGGKLILPDGRLQEAGSIIWNDGTCLGYGRGGNPYRSDVEFRRDVDYCSGAFLMLPLALFRELGWLDERYAPAYYEETDLCMRIRARGLRIVYDPAIEIQHFEFGSAATSQDALVLQARNAGIFRGVHAKALRDHHHPPGTALLRARDRSSARRLLIIDDRVPYPRLGTGYPRAREIILAIHQEGWSITLYPLMHPDVDFDEARKFFPAGMEIVADHGRRGLARFLRDRLGYYDAVMVSRPHNMETFKSACALLPRLLTETHIIYDSEALMVEREVLRQRILGTPLTPKQYQADLSKEMGLTEGADAIITVSPREAQLFSRLTPASVHVIGHTVTPRVGGTAFEQRRDILFVGALNGPRAVSPNVDSLCWFVDEVMPIIDRAMGTTWRLLVAGRIDSADVRPLACDRVRLLGMVEDLDGLYDACRVFIAPTRFAAGIPHKVHEASAHGLPTVATGLIAEQLGFVHEQQILAGDTAEDFAAGCLRLYQEPSLWQRLAAGALGRIEQDCSPPAFAAAIRRVLAEVPDRA